jgi:pyruvate dehydrogenase (quinone)
MNGLLGNPSGFKSLEKADVALMLGTDFPYAEFMPKDNLIVQIDKRAEIIGRRAKVDYGYQGDIKDTLEVLLPFLNVKKDKDFLEKMHALYVEEEKKYEKPKEDAIENKLNPEDAAVLINKYASDDAIFTVDTGMTCVWAARLIKASKNRYLTGSFNHGSMANALPMAIGAAASDKNKQVIAMCGDGGLSMLLGDLATVMQYQYPIKIFFFNNRSLGMVKLEMEVSGYIDWQTNMINPPFDKIAELMNIKGIEVKNIRSVCTNSIPVGHR